MATNHEVGSSILSGRTILFNDRHSADRFLAFVQFVSVGSNHTAHVEALIQQRHGLSLRTFIRRIIFPHKDLNPVGQETADGDSTTGG